jgi:hypothetical protein
MPRTRDIAPVINASTITDAAKGFVPVSDSVFKPVVAAIQDSCGIPDVTRLTDIQVTIVQDPRNCRKKGILLCCVVGSKGHDVGVWLPL